MPVEGEAAAAPGAASSVGRRRGGRSAADRCTGALGRLCRLELQHGGDLTAASTQLPAAAPRPLVSRAFCPLTVYCLPRKHTHCNHNYPPSHTQAYEVLGLPNKDHTFDQILTAKNKQMAASPSDVERQLQVRVVAVCARVCVRVRVRACAGTSRATAVPSLWAA
jgi:hypothetical protein